MKVMFVFGTRPEAIKLAPLINKFKSYSDFFDVKVCVTGQHREMLDQTLKVFDIVPDIDLDIMKPGQDLSDLTANIICKMRNIFNSELPDAAIVHGDTTTTLATAMAGFYCNISVAHVEAGLRTYDTLAPFPEEFNRQVISKIAKWHFAPTEISKKNLLSEGVPKENIYVTGNTVIDALFDTLTRIDENKLKYNNIKNFFNSLLPFDLSSQRYVLITGHRRENFGKGFKEICEAINKLAKNYPKIQFIYPVHLNPNVMEPVNKSLSDIKNVHLIKTQDYEPFVYLLKKSYFVLTDSGGIQEEAPSLGKPVLVMRDVTERPEAVTAGTVKLVGASQKKIIKGVSELLENKEVYRRMSQAHNPYGNGYACDIISDIMKSLVLGK